MGVPAAPGTPARPYRHVARCGTRAPTPVSWPPESPGSPPVPGLSVTRPDVGAGHLGTGAPQLLRTSPSAPRACAGAGPALAGETPSNAPVNVNLASNEAELALGPVRGHSAPLMTTTMPSASAMPCFANPGWRRGRPTRFSSPLHVERGHPLHGPPSRRARSVLGIDQEHYRGGPTVGPRRCLDPRRGNPNKKKEVAVGRGKALVEAPPPRTARRHRD